MGMRLSISGTEAVTREGGAWKLRAPRVLAGCLALGRAHLPLDSRKSRQRMASAAKKRGGVMSWQEKSLGVYISHVVGGAVVLTAVPSFFDGTLAGVHISCMILGLSFFLSNGVLLAIDFRALVGDKRKRAISVHLLYQALGLLLLLLGFAAMWVNKSLQGHPHLATTHGVLGFTALLALTAAAVGGAFSFRALGILDKLPGLLQPYVKSAHRHLGAAAWCLALYVAWLGLSYPKRNRGLRTYAWKACLLVLLGTAAVQGLGPMLQSWVRGRRGGGSRESYRPLGASPRAEPAAGGAPELGQDAEDP